MPYNHERESCKRVMGEDYKKLEHNLVYKGSIVDFYKDKMQLPNQHVVDWDYIHHKGAAAIIPIDENDEILMVRQYRIGTECELLEIPAGALNPGEDPFESALREMEEETGYVSSNVKHLIDVYAAPAYTSECVSIYYAKDLQKTRQNFDEDEFIVLERYPLDELIQMIMEGKIVDGKTISGLFALKEVLYS